MSDLAKKFFGPALLTTSSQTLFTVAASKAAIIRNIHIANTSGTAATVKVSIGVDAAGTRILGDLSIPANSTYDWSGFLVLDGAEDLRAQAGTTNVLTITVSGVEVSP